jgi:hypothetical protein
MVSPDQPSQLPSTYKVMSLSVTRASDTPASSSAIAALSASFREGCGQSSVANPLALCERPPMRLTGGARPRRGPPVHADVRIPHVRAAGEHITASYGWHPGLHTRL